MSAPDSSPPDTTRVTADEAQALRDAAYDCGACDRQAVVTRLAETVLDLHAEVASQRDDFTRANVALAEENVALRLERDELLAFDAWAASVAVLVNARKIGAGKSPEAKAFASLDEAEALAFHFKLAAERAGTGLAPSVRGPLWRMGSEGFEVVHALLVRRSQKGAGA